MLTDHAPSSFWVLTNLTHTHTHTHTQAIVERTHGAAESKGWTEPGLPWQPVGSAAGEPQTGGALPVALTTREDGMGRREALACLLMPTSISALAQLTACWALPSLQARKSLLLPNWGVGGVGGWWTGGKNSEASCSVHPGDGGHISGEGGGSYFIHESEFKGRKVPSC